MTLLSPMQSSFGKQAVTLPTHLDTSNFDWDYVLFLFLPFAEENIPDVIACAICQKKLASPWQLILHTSKLHNLKICKNLLVCLLSFLYSLSNIYIQMFLWLILKPVRDSFWLGIVSYIYMYKKYCKLQQCFF